MNVIQPIQQLLHHLLNLAQAELYVDIRQQSSQIVFTEVKHQIERRSITIVLRRFSSTYFNQIHNILMLQQL